MFVVGQSSSNQSNEIVSPEEAHDHQQVNKHGSPDWHFGDQKGKVQRLYCCSPASSHIYLRIMVLTA
ncbi:hypothetical protein RIR_jg38189.t1 [Rhizophagus irregularis DAOM 181602=DAOM 197198]|nr:hypothetical protein RIR_jg38189.t1 [Rhizophagus irregularis DAOM 181602=DAOM 197198]